MAECAGLENRSTRKGTRGSNPLASAFASPKLGFGGCNPPKDEHKSGHSLAKAPHSRAKAGIASPKLHSRAKAGKQQKMNQPHFIWQAPKYHHQPKTTLWFVYGLLISLAVLLFAIFTKNYIFVLFIIIAVWLVWQKNNQTPEIITLKIGHEGIEIGSTFIPYSQIKSFWIFYEPPYLKEISFIVEGFASQPKKMILTDQDPNDIREFLLDYLSEKEQHISIFESISKYLGI